jgi:hypothetical protein
MTLTIFQKECLIKASKLEKITRNRTSIFLMKMGLLSKSLKITERGKVAIKQKINYFHITHA